jgi:hypothetical protein
VLLEPGGRKAPKPRRAGLYGRIFRKITLALVEQADHSTLYVLTERGLDVLAVVCAVARLDPIVVTSRRFDKALPLGGCPQRARSARDVCPRRTFAFVARVSAGG